MNEIIRKCVLRDNNIDIRNCSQEDLSSIVEINVSDSTMDKEHSHWDFSLFPNLKKIDCSYVPISSLNIEKNQHLEYLRWEGVRGNISSIDLSSNKKLKEIRGGQDGLKELDLSSNTELEKIDIFLSSDLRWINLDNCKKLKSISLHGVLVPMVDLTQCNNLEYVNISYLNTYRNKSGEFGNGFPRPFIFVANDFDTNVISRETRQFESYCYFLVKVRPNSNEQKALRRFRGMKNDFLEIENDMRRINIATNHYVLRRIFDRIMAQSESEACVNSTELFDLASEVIPESRITREMQDASYLAYSKCHKYNVKMQSFLIQNHIIHTLPQVVCKEDCLYPTCPFYSIWTITNRALSHKHDYDEWIVEEYQLNK